MLGYRSLLRGFFTPKTGLRSQIQRPLTGFRKISVDRRETPRSRGGLRTAAACCLPPNRPLPNGLVWDIMGNNGRQPARAGYVSNG
jgi:hypothetical protein